MTQQGNRVPDASADEQAKAASTEDYGGVPVSDGELADVWLAEPEQGANGSTADDDDLDDADDAEFAGYDPLADDTNADTDQPPPPQPPA